MSAITNSFILMLLVIVFSVTSVSNVLAAEIVLDTGHYHLGDDFKEELNPVDPEGLVYTANFTLDHFRLFEFTILTMVHFTFFIVFLS